MCRKYPWPSGLANKIQAHIQLKFAEIIDTAYIFSMFEEIWSLLLNVSIIDIESTTKIEARLNHD